MKLKKYCFAVLLLFMALNRPAAAAAGKCSYSRSLQLKGTTFDVVSRPARGCDIQIVTVGVRRDGKKIAGMKADVDYLAQSARMIDLTGDGKPELAVISLTPGGKSEALDVYWLDGASLHRLNVPEPDENSGYKGGDRYDFEERMIVRTIPVYRAGDQSGKPTGGTRAFKYEFRDGAFSLYVQTDKEAEPAGVAATQSAAPAVQAAAETKPVTQAAAALAVTGIIATETGIEIRANGVVEKHRTVRLDKPERIAIDLPGADSSLAGKKITINRFGITAVRVGRNKGFLRVVLDTSLGKFPKYEVKSAGTAVLIEFTQ